MNEWAYSSSSLDEEQDKHENITYSSVRCNTSKFLKIKIGLLRMDVNLELGIALTQLKNLGTNVLSLPGRASSSSFDLTPLSTLLIGSNGERLGFVSLLFQTLLLIQ